MYDDSTGGHIRRSSEYAVLIAKTLRKEEKYRNIITIDYLDNLVQSAPMHDIGKIGISDAILQKPGKLTDEEYTKMKEHTLIGGKIIKDTFGHLYNGEYENMAYNVAMYHHEKWNGRGYPNGLKEEEYLCVHVLWRWQMSLMPYQQKDAIGTQCRLRNVIILLKKEEEKISNLK